MFMGHWTWQGCLEAKVASDGLDVVHRHVLDRKTTLSSGLSLGVVSDAYPMSLTCHTMAFGSWLALGLRTEQNKNDIIVMPGTADICS